MKKQRTYSDKEKSIFEGIITLLNKGYHLHELKVADISAAAGMGKSTAYEYFSSKEQIIKEAIYYHVYKESQAFARFISSQRSFTGVLEKSMDYIIDMLKTRFSGLLLMVLNLEQSELLQFVCEDNDMVAEIQKSINAQVQKILALGKKEGLVGQDITTDDGRIVLIGLISAFSNEVRLIHGKTVLPFERIPKRKKTHDSEKAIEDLKRRTINIILKALK